MLKSLTLAIFVLICSLVYGQTSQLLGNCEAAYIYGGQNEYLLQREVEEYAVFESTEFFADGTWFSDHGEKCGNGSFFSSSGRWNMVDAQHVKLIHTLTKDNSEDGGEEIIETKDLGLFYIHILGDSTI